MRISDWSSDVCSSDLRHPRLAHCRSPGCARVRYIGDRNTGLTDLLENLLADHRLEHAAAISGLNVMNGDPGIIECAKDGLGAKRSRRSVGIADRKSVVSGKSVSVRVDLGGRSIIKKKKLS